MITLKEFYLMSFIVMVLTKLFNQWAFILGYGITALIILIIQELKND
jgi:hypothetical protein